ncbi:tyrosine-protein phosphatase non-receptor type 21 [Adelges cooleyi]|uniref:tyrosine-protein phosphatase non-receptor type 21 n=1 Tax=Adelges cooleyi TaxID=133065 RepID=UPI00217FAE96|nr:tyrosine-protein phosphatase non-receptor type 21 [Adelges cooleyi]XP_050442640.1 tyrosine-protein phosphatase non-receptor type 21 [Adelges cooleyi]
MPFKIRLKKSRQYNVVSKSLYVICVELLDSTSIECTLSAESVGQECLDSVCQRLGLHQPEILGLRYISRSGNPRWVDLSRPLKRQLDKFACHFSLYLRVMYYVSNVTFIKDEMTRYHFFLQLKMDVIEGRIICDADQAVLLASYSMQAEFGNHDLEKHTSEYLKDFALFPKHLTQQERLESLVEAVICQHLALAGLPQGTAEEYYIVAAQHLEGYGQEKFHVKDDNSAEVALAISLKGVTIQNQNKTVTVYQWEDIANVINHKRYFSMEGQHDNFIQFQCNDVETAKYVWSMCILQHRFYGLYEKIDQTGDNKADVLGKSLDMQIDNNADSSRDELDAIDTPDSNVIRGPFSLNGIRAQSTSCLDLSSQTSEKFRLDKTGHKSISKLPSYRLAPDYETAVQRKYLQGNYFNQNANLIPTTSISHQDINLHQFNNDYKQFPDVTQVNMASTDRPIHGQTSDLDISTRDSEYVQIYKPPPPYPISNSTPDLARAYPLGYIQNPVSGSSPDLLSSRVHHFHVAPQRYNASHMLSNTDTHRTYTNLNALLGSRQNLNELRSGFNGNNMMYYMGQYGPILNQPHTGLLVNEQPHNCNNVVAKFTEPIYENVPLLWNSKEVRSRAASVQSAPEIKSPTKVSQPVPPPQPVKEDVVKPQKETTPVKNVALDVSSSSNVSSQINSTIISHSAEQSFDSSNQSSNSGTLKKEGRSKNRRKWAGLLGGAGKSKTLSRSGGGVSSEEFNQRHSTVSGLPIPSTISKDTMCNILQHKLEDAQLFQEFDKITKVKPNAEFSTAFVLENYSRNRHKDILPYEENRVRLSPSKENRFGYINASHITASVGNEQRFYIATQTPLPGTVNHFWQMVWEAGVHLILDLSWPKTNASDDSYGEYFPTVADHSVQFGEYHVWLQFTQETGHCVTSKLKLQHNSSRRSRSVWHLQYVQWAEQDCPANVSHFLGFLEEMSSVREHTITEIPTGQNRNPPILVHCSTGVGRTGLTVLSDLLLYTLDHNQELDIPKTISLARHQRMLFVETVTQYKFVHSLLIYYLKNSRLI